MQDNMNTPVTLAEKEQLKRNFDGVFGRFTRAVERSGRKLGRRTGEVQLVAVSKWHSLQRIVAVAEHWNNLGGDPVFSENYIQESIAKQDGALALGHSFSWHFTGHMQSNKAKYAVRRFELLHALDSLTLAQNLQKALRKGDSTVKDPLNPDVQPVLVQVNIGLEDSKSGIFPDEIEKFLESLQNLDAVDVQGLMILPPFSDNPEATRPYFARLRQMRDRLEHDLGISLPHLSMGMSHDFEAAIEEGATLVRVGTDIFGQRQY